MNKIGPDYIGLLVLGVFNAAIGRQNIRSDFQYKAEVSASPVVTACLHAMSAALWRWSGCGRQSPCIFQHSHQAIVHILAAGQQLG